MADSHIAYRVHAVPLPCRAAKGLGCVITIWFTQFGRVWFTLTMPFSGHAVLLKATAQHGRRETAVLWPWEERHGHGMANVNQTRPHCANQMGKTHSKPLAARHGRGTAWECHAMCESAFTVLVDSPSTPRQCHSAFAMEFHCDIPRSDVTTFVMFLRNRFCECTGLMEGAAWPSGLWPSCYDWDVQGA